MNTRTICLAALVLAMSTVLAAQTPGPCMGVSGTAYVNWQQFHSDICHTGYNASEVILNPANVGNLVLAWKYDTGIESTYPRPQSPMGWCISGTKFQVS